ncbi:unnamed protein product [Caenorhabditis nigoni]
MPINLLTLPCLVGEIVVTELGFQEIFLISLCSRRTNFLVKKARIKVPKLAFQLEQYHGHNKFKIGVMTDRPGWRRITSLLHVTKLASENVSNVKLGLDYEAETRFVVRSKKGGKFRHRLECANEPMTIQKALQDHINSIFHYSNSNKLILSMKCEGSLPNITNVTEIEIRDDTVDPQFITNVLTTYPDHKRLCVRSKIVGELPKDSPFFQVQNVYVAYGSNSCGPDYFHNFAGRNMRLDNVTLTDQDFILFLLKWISNEAYHKLESLTISHNSINEDIIRQAIEFEEYDPSEPEKRPEHFPIDMPFKYNFPLRRHNVFEIKRIKDGRRAFVSMSSYYFLFLVHQN